MRKLNLEKSTKLMDYADENLLWYPSSANTMDPPKAFMKNYNALRGLCGIKKTPIDMTYARFVWGLALVNQYQFETGDK